MRLPRDSRRQLHRSLRPACIPQSHLAKGALRPHFWRHHGIPLQHLVLLSFRFTLLSRFYHVFTRKMWVQVRRSPWGMRCVGERGSPSTGRPSWSSCGWAADEWPDQYSPYVCLTDISLHPTIIVTIAATPQTIRQQVPERHEYHRTDQRPNKRYTI